MERQKGSDNFKKSETSDPNEYFCPFCDKEISKSELYFCQPVRFFPKGKIPRFIKRICNAHFNPQTIEEEEIKCKECEKIFYKNYILSDSGQNKDVVSKKDKIIELIHEALPCDDFCLNKVIKGLQDRIFSFIILFGIISIIFGSGFSILTPVYIHYSDSCDVYGMTIILLGILSVAFGILFRKKPEDKEEQKNVAQKKGTEAQNKKKIQENDIPWIINQCFGTDISEGSILYNLIMNTVIVIILWTLLLFYPAIITDTILKFHYDQAIMYIIPLFFIVMLTIYQGQISLISEINNPQDLSVLGLNKTYKESHHCTKFKEVSINGYFYGVKGKPHLIRMLFGFIAVCLGVWYFMFYWPPYLSLFEVITPVSNPPIFYSWPFKMGWLAFYLPFWFILGSIVWVNLAISNYIHKIACHIHLKFSFSSREGDTKKLGEILVKSNMYLALLALGFIYYWYFNINNKSAVFLKFNLILMSIFVIVIFFGFILPLLPIHREMKAVKKEEISQLMKEIHYDKILKKMNRMDEINYNLLRIELIKEISSRSVWPFQFNSFIKIIIMTLIPLIQMISSIHSMLN